MKVFGPCAAAVALACALAIAPSVAGTPIAPPAAVAPPTSTPLRASATATDNPTSTLVHLEHTDALHHGVTGLITMQKDSSDEIAIAARRRSPAQQAADARRLATNLTGQAAAAQRRADTLTAAARRAAAAARTQAQKSTAAKLLAQAAQAQTTARLARQSAQRARDTADALERNARSKRPAPVPPPARNPPSYPSVCDRVISTLRPFSLPSGWTASCVKEVSYKMDGYLILGVTYPGERRIEVRNDQTEAMMRAVWVHELSHAFSYGVLTPAQRQFFADKAGAKDFETGDYDNVPAEIWANSQGKCHGFPPPPDRKLQPCTVIDATIAYRG